MDLQLHGKVAMVTGGTRGIGRAIVEALLAEGCRVAFCARSADGVASASSELGGAGSDVAGTAVDVSDGDGVKRWVKDTAAQFGGLDIFISNVSAMARSLSAEDWQKSLQIDVLCPQFALAEAQPLLEAAAQKNGDAAVLAISSVSGVLSMQAESYGAMKAALCHYISGKAKELARVKVRANTLSPGTIYFEDGFWGEIERNQPEYFEQMREMNPTQRFGTPQEVADAALFLVSPRASFVTGSNMIVDGGIKPCVSF